MSTLRIPPHNEEAERGVIGAVFCGRARCFDSIIEAHKLVASDFYIPAFGTAWEVMAEMAQADIPIDAVTFKEQAGHRYEEVGGDAAVEAIIDKTPTAAHGDYYAELVKTKAKLRAICQFAREADAAAHEDNADPNMVASKLEMDVHNTVEAESVLGPKTNVEAYDANMEMWERAVYEGGVGLQTGVQTIDEGFGGILPGLLFIISGPPKSCKTTLARNIMENLAMRGVRVAFKSLEQTKEQVVGSITARLAGVSISQLNKGCDGDVERFKRIKAKLQSVRELVQSLPIDIDDSPATMPELFSWWRRSVANGAELGVVDYIQEVNRTAQQGGMSKAEFMGEVNGGIVKMVKETRNAKGRRVSLIGISSETDGNLRWSGDIKYGLGGWASIKRIEDQDNLFELSMKAQRYGKCSPVAIQMRWWKDQIISDEEYRDYTARDEMMA